MMMIDEMKRRSCQEIWQNKDNRKNLDLDSKLNVTFTVGDFNFPLPLVYICWKYYFQVLYPTCGTRTSQADDDDDMNRWQNTCHSLVCVGASFRIFKGRDQKLHTRETKKIKSRRTNFQENFYDRIRTFWQFKNFTFSFCHCNEETRL